ncbi:hypothetical protein FHS29_006333 [Saccharothrix tamanrassetensis]|uniref:FAS1-like dehydratase domain-containing protein n=1 Tax=Saccharothrix tamanrassetensis TaxID=1051531 RepID=A0A841CML5_9PSEU|nr:MaoC family dehydratase N-terminal domain-containing protein [Saccharothrix tamanrassetensis]MBB5959712.1 hypothetical protein [Saccharothrix tamanrassetensis]
MGSARLGSTSVDGGPTREGGRGIDRAFIGTRLAPFTAEVDRSEVASFAEVLGLGGGVFADLGVARAAQHPDLPVPPTFLFGLEFRNPSDVLTAMGVELRHVLHVEQGFVYHRTAHAGERLTFSTVITDIYGRGGLEFVVQDTAVTDADGEPVADHHQIIAVRLPASGGEDR